MATSLKRWKTALIVCYHTQFISKSLSSRWLVQNPRQHTLSLTSYKSTSCCRMAGATSRCSVTAAANAGAAAFLITSTSCTTSSKSALHSGSGTLKPTSCHNLMKFHESVKFTLLSKRQYFTNPFILFSHFGILLIHVKLCYPQTFNKLGSLCSPMIPFG